MAGYEVQGRRSPNGVRLATETSRAAARATAHRMAVDGFTVWIFETEPGPRGKTYRLLETIRPPAP